VKDLLDSRVFVFLSLLVVVGAYVALSLNGSDIGSLNNAILILIGALAGVTVPK